MKILTYLIIFISKIIENALSTLRLIVVAKGKKVFGAILQFIIAFVWCVTTGIVVTNIKDDPLKIVFFALGSLIGSYIGSFVEEKIALGHDMITVITKKENANKLVENLEKNNYLANELSCTNNANKILFIINEKKKRKNILDIINKEDNDATITIESIKNISNNLDK